MGTRGQDVLELMAQLEDVQRIDGARYSTFKVHGHTFGYLWEPTQTVGLKQQLSEQLALVNERPETFEVQFTAGQFGWVVIHLAGVDRSELAELTYEAWRLTAPLTLVEARGDRLPH
ncbi:MAG TPA: MmcQ/YjbR family DNA-binding protein [Propionibacteriaceae bacterium]|nr:MmcQ/YjbR family DNA-binding protein [Propionibacteriaceae bacterium]